MSDKTKLDSTIDILARYRDVRNDLNRLMFGWRLNDPEKFEEGRVTMRVLSRRVRTFEKEINDALSE